MNFDQWGPLAIQIPVVVAFILHSKWTLEAFLTHLKVTGELDRAQRKEAMAVGLGEVKTLCGQIDAIVNSIQAHELGARERHSTIVERLRDKELGK